jgi:hypothetical protein
MIILISSWKWEEKTEPWSSAHIRLRLTFIIRLQASV